MKTDMKTFKNLVVLLTLCFLLKSNIAESAVTITPITNGSCLAISPGAFTTMSNIVVTEALVGDIGIGAGTTFILTAPAGFEFSAGWGSVTYTAGRDITSA